MSDIAKEIAMARAKIWHKVPKSDQDVAAEMCKTYNLRPILGHIQLIKRNERDEDDARGKPQWVTTWKPYITRDGLLHVAHSSGVKFAL